MYFTTAQCLVLKQEVSKELKQDNCVRFWFFITVQDVLVPLPSTVSSSTVVTICTVYHPVPLISKPVYYKTQEKVACVISKRKVPNKIGRHLSNSIYDNQSSHPIHNINDDLKSFAPFFSTASTTYRHSGCCEHIASVPLCIAGFAPNVSIIR